MLGWILFLAALWVLAAVMVTFARAAGLGKRRETLLDRLIVLPLTALFAVLEYFRRQCK